MKPTVLVIDDEKTFRIVAEEALSAEGFAVTITARVMNCAASLKARAIGQLRQKTRRRRCVCCKGSRAIW